MKKIIFIIIIILSCYLIYNFTKDEKLNYSTIGDSLSYGYTPYSTKSLSYSDYISYHLKKENKLNNYNNSFTNENYRITDVINLINNNTKKEKETINQIIASSDILTISLGMNEIYYKIKMNSNDIYNYIDHMINDMEDLFKLIKKYNNKKIYILGYYNVTKNNQDVFNYANIKLNKLCNKYSINYVDLSSIFYKNTTYFENPVSFNPNLEGYYKIYQKIIEKIENN